nr:unnamed protein product [Digitaria exilis]
MGRRRRRASPLDVDDLLAEILLRLPTLPTSLPYAFISDPPLGSILHDRFSVPARCQDAAGGDDVYTWNVRGCCHARVLLINTPRYDRKVHQFLVWNPLAGEQHLLGIPHFFDPDHDRVKLSNLQAAMIGDEGPFKVALAWKDGHTANACVYSSETGVWGDAVSAAVQPTFGAISVGSLSVLVGNSLYWMLFGSYHCILEFDLGSQKLSVIELLLPPNAYANHHGIYLTTLAAGGGLSLLIMSPSLRAQLWERTATSDDGVDRWMLGRTIELDKLLSLRPLGFQEYRSVLELFGMIM